jgi:hypothetical protein
MDAEMLTRGRYLRLRESLTCKEAVLLLLRSGESPYDVYVVALEDCVRDREPPEVLEGLHEWCMTVQPAHGLVRG